MVLKSRIGCQDLDFKVLLSTLFVKVGVEHVPCLLPVCLPAVDTMLDHAHPSMNRSLFLLAKVPFYCRCCIASD